MSSAKRSPLLMSLQSKTIVNGMRRLFDFFSLFCSIWNIEKSISMPFSIYTFAKPCPPSLDENLFDLKNIFDEKND